MLTLYCLFNIFFYIVIVRSCSGKHWYVL